MCGGGREAAGGVGSVCHSSWLGSWVSSGVTMDKAESGRARGHRVGLAAPVCLPSKQLSWLQLLPSHCHHPSSAGKCSSAALVLRAGEAPQGPELKPFDCFVKAWVQVSELLPVIPLEAAAAGLSSPSTLGNPSQCLTTLSEQKLFPYIHILKGQLSPLCSVVHADLPGLFQDQGTSERRSFLCRDFGGKKVMEIVKLRPCQGVVGTISIRMGSFGR